MTAQIVAPVLQNIENYPPGIASALIAGATSLNPQGGAATLVAGTVTVSGVTLTATSVLLFSRKTQGGTVTNTIGYEAPSASRNTGAGTFVLNAVVAAGTVNAADTSVIDWQILG